MRKYLIEVNKFPYRRERYVDYSHLAYNGVTDDF